LIGGSERNIIHAPPESSGMMPIAAPQVMPSGNVGQRSTSRYELCIVLVVRRPTSSSGVGGAASAPCATAAVAATTPSAPASAARTPLRSSARMLKAPAGRASAPDST
jgi:hypothetical protein